MADIFNVISTGIGLLASVWALVDPKNGPLKFLSTPPRRRSSFASLVAKSILLVISYAIMAAILFLTTKFLERNYGFKTSNYFPRNIIDYESAINYYNVSANNQIAKGKNIDTAGTLSKLWLCILSYLAFSIPYVTKDQPIGMRLLLLVILLVYDLFFVISFAVLAVIVVFLLDLFYPIGLSLGIMFSAIFNFGIFFTLPFITFLYRTKEEYIRYRPGFLG